jgi:uncharacterized protein YbbK (DUF523 family)
MSKKTVVASACCCGVTCRWHGKKTYKSPAIKKLEAEGIEVIPVCPEMLGGLSCPRPPVRTVKGRIYVTDEETRKDIGEDVTETFRQGALKALEQARLAGASRAYFFKTSPSCGSGGIATKMFRAEGIAVESIW